ncbi:MAG: glutamate-5-semialdehyde dehydrogenase [Nitrospinae bacterium]|jgi:glutamate-5-semialdehyde dehydrogenase|nr:glutamate-5-semialdehyde dehydrogenase [Nitrospinota bacterium]MDA1108494.1 glutamate-5-semialdehyde dehydrogenase [Nitrospinota bacterium]
MTVTEITVRAKAAALKLTHLSTVEKNSALEKMAQALEANSSVILEANRKDLEFAKQENIPGPLFARLVLDEAKVKSMARGIRSVCQLPDPVGLDKSVMEMDKGLVLHQVTCPIGVIGAIFESRPDAVPQIASLCLKSGNAVILKGGSEAQHTNKVIVSLLADAIAEVPGVPKTAIQMIETRAEVAEMLNEDKYINLIVPRGSNAFVRYIQENTKIPVLGHSGGICHGYIDQSADIEMAVRVVLDSKLQYPAACNAMENLLIHQDVAKKVLPVLVEKFQEQKVELVGCEKICQLAPEIKRADDSEWDTEYNDLKLALKIVADIDEAIEFINAHGSGHTDTILTEDPLRAEMFMNDVDSASVLWNASTRFADGFRYGLGAEIGISTNKTHARGPVGLEGLIIYKYKLFGKGQTVGDYSGEGAREFTHRPLAQGKGHS